MFIQYYSFILLERLTCELDIDWNNTKGKKYFHFKYLTPDSGELLDAA